MVRKTGGWRNRVTLFLPFEPAAETHAASGYSTSDDTVKAHRSPEIAMIPNYVIENNTPAPSIHPYSAAIPQLTAWPVQQYAQGRLVTKSSE